MSISLIGCEDNDSYAFREYPTLTSNQRIHQSLIPDVSGKSKPGVRRCPKCKTLMDKWRESLDGLRIKRRSLDISFTYDGITIASKLFRRLCLKERLAGLVFESLPDDPDFFAIQAKRAVEFDFVKRKSRFENRCDNCGQFESVVGATPVYLKPGSKIGNREFVRTDLEFGSDDEKHPLLLCGEKAAEILAAARLRGIDIKELEPRAKDSHNRVRPPGGGGKKKLE